MQPHNEYLEARAEDRPVNIGNFIKNWFGNHGLIDDYKKDRKKALDAGNTALAERFAQTIQGLEANIDQLMIEEIIMSIFKAMAMKHRLTPALSTIHEFMRGPEVEKILFGLGSERKEEVLTQMKEFIAKRVASTIEYEEKGKSAGTDAKAVSDTVRGHVMDLLNGHR